jgi:ribonuclease HI
MRSNSAKPQQTARRNSSNMLKDNTLSILQYNVNKSRDKVMAGLLADERALEYDIIAIQEPWRNPFHHTTYHPVKDRFDLIYQDSESTRVCFFINIKLRGSWTYTHHSPDYTTIALQIQEHHPRTIHIHNVYNPSPWPACPLGTLPLLERTLEGYNTEEEHIVLGDFNLHHPHWAGVDHRTAHREADELLAIAEANQLQLLLPPGTPTRQERDQHTTIDLVFATPLLADSIITCRLDEELDHDSDHLPVSTVIGMTTFAYDRPNRRIWHQLDEKLLHQTLAQSLPASRIPTDTQDLDKLTEEVVKAVMQSIEQAVPASKACARSIPGWTPAIKEAQMVACRLRRQYQWLRTAEAWEAYRKARNEKGRLIKKALRKAHRTRIQEATASTTGLWKLARWAKNRELRQAQTPPLKTADGELATDPQQKAHALQQAFFPKPPEADLSDLHGYKYLAPIEFPPITEQEIARAIKRAAPRKAPGTDGIPSLILQRVAPELVPILHVIYNACLNLGHYPTHFKSSITVVLRKPGKDDYTMAKSYRPVALLNTIGKAFDSVIAQRISYAAETYGLLPQTHLGGRKGLSTEHAIHLLVEQIHAGWNTSHAGGVASLLCLDVPGAPDYVSHPRLLHNLRKCRTDLKTIQCIESFLKHRTTTIRLDNHTSAPMEVNTGIPQGSPISPILYLFYNADLLEACEDSNLQTSAIGFIDDVSIIAASNSTETNCQSLASIHTRCQDWARKHASKFNPTKYSLVHIPKRGTRQNLHHPVELPGLEPIQPQEHCRLLGLIVDSKLSWNQHVKHIQAKATKSLGALASLAGSTWGTGYQGLRQIYNAVVVPQLLYGCSAWFAPTADRKKYMVTNVEKLASIQHRAARIITGAFRATSKPALDVEAFSTPMRLRLEREAIHAYMRIVSSPLHATLEDIRGRAYTKLLGPNWRLRPRLWTTLERHHDHYQSRLGQDIEQLEVKSPYIAAPWWPVPEVTIHEEPDQAEKSHDDIVQTSYKNLLLYTDGSGINGKIGAAVIAPQIGAIRRAYMGAANVSTVYAAEFKGVRMAIEIAIDIDHDRAIIFSDSQAVLKAIQNPGRPSGQYILRQVVDSIDELRGQGKEVALHWIPAHRGIKGNEGADIAAKEATGWRLMRQANGKLKEIDTNRTAPKPAELKCLQAALKQAIRKDIAKEWEQIWNTETRGRDLFRVTSRPTKAVLRLHQGLSRPLSSLLTQMRTGRIGLRQYLYSRNVPDIEDDRCGCGQSTQTIAHVLLNCRRHTRLREEIWTEEDDNGRKKRIRTTDLREILSTPAYATKAAKLMKATGLLGQFRSCDTTD